MKKILLGLVLTFSLIVSQGAFAQSQSINLFDIPDAVIGGAGNISDNILGNLGRIEGIKDDWKDRNKRVTPEGRFELPDAELFNTIGENVSLRQYILNVLNFVLSFLGLIAVAALIYAGFLYVTSRGEDSANEKSKKILIFAVLGILLILASFAIVNTVIKNAGVGTNDRNGISNQYDPVTGSPITPGTPTNPGTPGTPGGGSIINGILGNPIVVTGPDVQDSLNVAYVSLEGAKQGIGVSLSVQARAIVDFGDGYQVLVDTTLNPDLVVTHQYGQAGTYEIYVLVQTVDGAQSTFSKRLNVGGLSPQLRLPVGKTLINTPVTLDSTGSATAQGTILSHKWSCAGGCFPDTEGAQATVQFTTPGTFEVTLTLTNSLGQSASKTGTITVASDTPIANFEFQSTNNPDRPSEFQFNGGLSTNVDGNDQGLTYNWSFDGIVQKNTYAPVTYIFPTSGSATVELFVTQNFNGKVLQSETVSQTVQVNGTISSDFDVY